jgi:hypothetical protein
MEGMSGSPVYLDGKLAGAVAMAFPFAKDPIAAIRPIEDMVRPSTVAAAQAAAWRWPTPTSQPSLCQARAGHGGRRTHGGYRHAAQLRGFSRARWRPSRRNYGSSAWNRAR